MIVVDNINRNNIIGKGTHATIYSVKHKNKDMAVKVFCLSSELSQTAFFKEVYAYKLLGNKRHRICENIENYIDIGYGYISMKKYDCDLYTYAFESNILLTDRDMINIFKNICKSVKILHKKNIAHLDIKPENILVDIKSNEFVLTDFGCSYFGNSGQTTISEACGTPFYFPTQDKYIDPFKVDIYSLGVTLFVLLTKSFPRFNKKTNKWIVEEHYNLSLTIISFLNSLLTPNINERPSINEVLKSPIFKKSYKKRYRLSFPI